MEGISSLNRRCSKRILSVNWRGVLPVLFILYQLHSRTVNFTVKHRFAQTLVIITYQQAHASVYEYHHHHHPHHHHHHHHHHHYHHNHHRCAICTYSLLSLSLSLSLSLAIRPYLPTLPSSHLHGICVRAEMI